MDKRRRDRISSAVAFLCGTNKLRSEQRMLEKMQEKLISNMKSLSLHERNELLDYARTLESNANKDIAELQEELFYIFGLLKEVTREINDPEKLKQHDISYFRSKINELEKRIYSLQGNCNRELKKLEDEEVALTRELDLVEDRFEEWTNGTIRNSVKRAQTASKVKCSCSDDTLTPEVKMFRKFLDKTGGHYGGWTEDDHLLYLQLRQKHNPSATASLIHQKCPDISVERALAHDTWFETYTQLKKDQERSIREWRENQRFSHAKTCYKYDGPKINKSSVTLKRDPELKEKLKSWKEHQKIKKEVELEEKKKLVFLKKKEDELKRQKQQRRRAFVNEYKLQKLNSEQALEMARQIEEEKEKQLSAARANSMLKAFREEDMKYALRMRERLQQQKEKNNFQRSSSSSECSIKISRDPERLLKPTEGWRLKTAKRDDDYVDMAPPVLHLRNIPHLGIPEWRRGLPFDA